MPASGILGSRVRRRCWWRPPRPCKPPIRPRRPLAVPWRFSRPRCRAGAVSTPATRVTTTATRPARCSARASGHDIGTALGHAEVARRAGDDGIRTRRRAAIDDKPLARRAVSPARWRLAETGRAARSGAGRGGAESSRRSEARRLVDARPSQSLGSPATYGTALATSSARATLSASGASRETSRSRRTDRWLRAVDVGNVLDASAVVLGLGRGRRMADNLRRPPEHPAAGQAPTAAGARTSPPRRRSSTLRWPCSR